MDTVNGHIPQGKQEMGEKSRVEWCYYGYFPWQGRLILVKGFRSEIERELRGKGVPEPDILRYFEPRDYSQLSRLTEKLFSPSPGKNG